MNYDALLYQGQLDSLGQLRHPSHLAYRSRPLKAPWALRCTDIQQAHPHELAVVASLKADH